MYKFIYKIIATLVVVGLSGCASMNSPQGGPVDSLPPAVKSTSPLPFTTNFTGKRVTIDFVEYIQLKDQQKLFFVSPEIEKKPQLSIKGRSVVVDFQDTLLANQTYRLDFGSSIVDNNEGNKLVGYSFTFSTGPQIDSLVMAGQTLDAQTRDTVIGAFIPFFDVLKDSTYAERGLDSTLFKTRAEALFRTDSSGYFIADILKEKPYRIYAIGDKNGNQRYEMGVDMVAFIDSTNNPIDMPPFMFGYDSTKRRMVIDTVQFTFELFSEEAVKRQMLMTQERPSRAQLRFLFAARDARADSLILDSIPASWLIKDQVPSGDTLTYWIAPPTAEQYEALGDTIKGRLIYSKQDSVMQYYADTAKVNLVHVDQAKLDKAKKEKAELEEKEKEKEKAKEKNKGKEAVEEKAPAVDSTEVVKEPNPFGFQVKAASELNPESNIVLTFDNPIISIDSSKIELTEIAVEHIKGARRNSPEQSKEIRTVVPARVTVDNLRQVTLATDWKSGAKYELLIPAECFKNSIHQSNDTLKSSFTILDPDKFGTLTLKTTADSLELSDSSLYIFELVTIKYATDKNEQTIVGRTTGVRAGDVVRYRFLAPGDYYLRITEDTNRDGKWTTGDLRHRRRPERVRFVTDHGARLPLKSKEGWDVEEMINLTKVINSQ